MKQVMPIVMCLALGLLAACTRAEEDGVDETINTPTAFELPVVEHVVIIGIDGMGGLFFEGPTTPTLDKLMLEAAYSLTMQNVLPTSSSTNWMSMVNGQGTDGHGVYSNGWSVGESDPADTIVKILREQRPDSTIGVFHDWGDFGRLVEDNVADIKEDPGDENETAAAAIDFIKNTKPTLTFIHLDHVDHAGHATGWVKNNDDCLIPGGCPYVEAVEEADALVSEILTAIEDAGIQDKTAVLISADHGGMFLGHGGDTYDERCIPFIVTGPGVKPGLITRTPRIFDIPATAAALLGLDIPDAWVGRPVLDAFQGYVLPQSQNELVDYQLVQDYTRLYDDTGSGANEDLSLWRPVVPDGYHALGDVAVSGSRDAPSFSVPVIKESTLALVEPIGYELLWSDEGSGSDSEDSGKGISLWHGIAPAGYTCLGVYAFTGYTQIPKTNATRCIHDDYLVAGERSMIWTDAGSGADLDAAIWSCQANTDEQVATHTFISRRSALDGGMDLCRSLTASGLRLVSGAQ
jgi:hypothetical protein